MDLLNVKGIFTGSGVGRLEFLWGKVGFSSMILESLSGSLRREVQQLSLICGCGCLVPVIFWLEFRRYSWMIVPRACKWSSPIGDMLCVWGFCYSSLSSLLPVLLLHPTQLSLENGLECKMGEKPQAELLTVGLRWRGWVGWTEVFLTHSYMRTRAILVCHRKPCV